ncbi:hypothetical protein M8C21_031410, partial [Ambrosia artemisiifolia]
KPANVIHIVDSDDEGGGDQDQPQVQNNNTINDHLTLENRSFWKAGSLCIIAPTKWAPNQAKVLKFTTPSVNMTQRRATQSVGLLSYTFLRRTGQDDVIVPMFEDIGSHGTKIIIYNLWLNDEGIYELNFDEDDEDIKLRDETAHLSKLRKKVAETQAHISYRLLHSLRAYASMLYLRKFKNFKIILRGKPVEQYNIADDLRNPQINIYRPHVASTKEAVMETTLGFIKEAPAIGVNGFNVYHKNRLIRDVLRIASQYANLFQPFWKVTSEGNSRGYGVVGVLEANFIEPAHDKQDFERSKQYCHLVGHQPDPSSLHKAQKTAATPIQNQGEAFDQNSPITGHPANRRLNLSGSQMGSYGRAVYNNATPPGFDQEMAHGDCSRDIDEIREENIQLFIRSEQSMQRETELKTM